MLAQIALWFKGILEFLGIAKYFYKEFKTTEIQKESKIDERIESEKEKAKKEGRP